MYLLLAFILLTHSFAEGYPRADLLVERADAVKDGAAYFIIDCRDRAAYHAGHVPDAVPHQTASPWHVTCLD